jgi:hypothetical protein
VGVASRPDRALPDGDTEVPRIVPAEGVGEEALNHPHRTGRGLHHGIGVDGCDVVADVAGRHVDGRQRPGRIVEAQGGEDADRSARLAAAVDGLVGPRGVGVGRAREP